MLRTTIIEDEELSRIVLQNLIETYCPDLEIVGHADTVKKGVELIKEQDPAILFLDVQLLDGTGFDILERSKGYNGAVIFTTAYDHYAVKAFKFSAIDYLLKPIDIDELKKAVNKASTATERTFGPKKISHLLSNLKRNPEEQPLLLVSTLESIEFIKINDILRCEAQGAYCKLYMRGNKTLLASKVIKEFDLLLRDYAFFRVHQSHLVNLTQVRKYVKAHGSLIMEDDKEIQVARSRKDDFLRAMQEMSHAGILTKVRDIKK